VRKRGGRGGASHWRRFAKRTAHAPPLLAHVFVWRRSSALQVLISPAPSLPSRAPHLPACRFANQPPLTHPLSSPIHPFAAPSWDPYDVEELRGKTLGVVGYGDIGQATAKLARAFRCARGEGGWAGAGAGGGRTHHSSSRASSS
jgi:hypothetical protein